MSQDREVSFENAALDGSGFGMLADAEREASLELLANEIGPEAARELVDLLTDAVEHRAHRTALLVLRDALSFFGRCSPILGALHHLLLPDRASFERLAARCNVSKQALHKAEVKLRSEIDRGEDCPQWIRDLVQKKERVR